MVYIEGYILIDTVCTELEPGVPGRVHPAEVVSAAGCCHQLTNLALCPIKGAETGESAGDGCHCLPHLSDDHLSILLINLKN